MPACLLCLACLPAGRRDRCAARTCPVWKSIQLGIADTFPPTPAHPQTETNERFKFGKVDLELLAQINLFDERFEKEGLVYHEAALDAYLDRVGKIVVAGKEIENVNWRFRVLRDSEPNAFALPNGSIYINTGMLALLEVFTKPAKSSSIFRTQNL